MGRERWKSRTVFLFAAIGSAVGLGNVWRFPYMTYKFGGGAFLIPYLIALFVIGIPLLMLEFALGQKFQRGAVDSFRKIHHKLGGIGVLAVLSGFIIVLYYAVIMAWTLIYMLNSFSSELPWVGNADGYFHTTVLGLTDSVSSIGGINIPLLIALFVIWVAIYFIVRKGVDSVGKVVMISMPLPLILMLVLFIRGIFLPGAFEGIIAYLQPDLSALMDPDIWIAAVAQIFFTLSIGFGIMTAYASFNSKNQNVRGDTYITAISDAAMSLFAGFVVFAILGYMATTEGVAVADVATSGPGLAFVVFPEALSLLPSAWFFSLLFFLALFALGIDSAFSIVEAVNTTIGDRYKKPNRPKIAFFTCLISFLLGIIFVTGAGLYFLDIVDYFINNYGLVTAGLLEAVVIGWYFGPKKIRLFVNKQCGCNIRGWWDYAIKYVIPIALIILLGYQFYTDITTPYGGYPQWALAIGWVSFLIPLIIAIVFSLKGKREDVVQSKKRL
ncbi:sodium-dependent transporter [Candidatus Pacearchaeota archaeon CG10_big_fil_rev_8_21_14_0_10_35_219]|nr:sodium-dependent transporter [Candidatus Pacearchaeota archaeon]OIO41983.1 MAG: sodium-dependent transporter [Candidatus Pacearchaeota archaeon CG1_02_35_32]PIO07811.1 MAG: sodium-dependent transporter [Candidatus Pacearchaeota archaeon CG10_big_fil_rev_8_21_14_0_10_35_219]PIY81033.1 MAG: sodium-dependent transporter [Candidatus Pacearchaeota archaeon CG_4_10_14_0_8_um_filter_35_169]PIZ79902.1 MAG: sodium-dependent transporter [Candidatus Pacearchaeota archaeon CG_4_10_14_0_2_um_filter_35_33